MTFSLAIASGDLVVQGGQCVIVSGVDKLRQDLEMWMLERYGANRMHPTFGSVLQNFIGGIVGSSTQADVYNEVLRVLNNYQAVVYALFSANPARFSISELPYSIDAVNVGISYDTVYCTVAVSNPGGTATVSISPTSL